MENVGAENHILFDETGFTGSSRYFFAFPQGGLPAKIKTDFFTPWNPASEPLNEI